MLRRVGKAISSFRLLSSTQLACFSDKKYKVINNPSEISKLVFNDKGLCKIYEYKMGQNTLRKIVRYVTTLTFVNGMLFALEQSVPIFGKINMISLGLATGLGYFLLSFVQVYSTRIVHRLFIADDFQTVHIQFFNAFWKPITLIVNISEFQQPVPGFSDYTRFELTRKGKIWINLNRNEFKNVSDYEETLNYVLLGNPLTNLNLINLRKKGEK